VHPVVHFLKSVGKRPLAKNLARQQQEGGTGGEVRGSPVGRCAYHVLVYLRAAWCSWVVRLCRCVCACNVYTPPPFCLSPPPERGPVIGLYSGNWEIKSVRGAQAKKVLAAMYEHADEQTGPTQPDEWVQVMWTLAARAKM
jgi:hypothetical protein